MNRLLIEGIALALLVAAAGWWLHERDIRFENLGIQKQVAVEKAAAKKQKDIDDQKFADAGRAHVKEIVDLDALYNGGGDFHVVCHAQPRSVSTTTVQADQSRPAGDSGQGVQMPDRDISTAFKLLARRLDTLNADAREVNAETR